MNFFKYFDIFVVSEPRWNVYRIMWSLSHDKFFITRRISPLNKNFYLEKWWMRRERISINYSIIVLFDGLDKI
jgi:hypothetical protein